MTGAMTIGGLLAAVLSLPFDAVAQTSPRPAIGPERAFSPPPRVERTLPNGLRVIVGRYVTVPKVSVVLTIESGLAVDPAEKAGLAQFVADTQWHDLPERVRRQAKLVLFDTFGVILAGSVRPEVVKLRE